MKVLNVLWHFSTGGIGKCFLTYDKLGDYDRSIHIKSVCIVIDCFPCDIEPLIRQNVELIHISSQRDFSWVSKLGRISNEYVPDVVFCHGFNGPIVVKVCSLFNKSLRVPMVCTYHGLYNPPTASKRPIATTINKVQAWMYKRYAKAVVLVAKYSGEYLLEHGVPKSKLKVVYNGLAETEPDMPAVQLAYDGISIGVAGRLDAIKGLNYLLDAIPDVIKRVDEKFHVYIVGDGPEDKNLRVQVKNLGIEDYISFEGYQSNVPAWLKSWDIFCLPSLQENHSIALLEAMRAGNAIICTNVGGNPETVDNGKEALLVDAADPEAIASNLVKLIESPSIRNNLGCNAKYRFYKEFTEDIMKERLCKLLKSVVQS